jgi:Leucine-rich repeat (LRR) protein
LIPLLERFPGLERLYLDGTQFGDSDIPNLVQSLMKNTPHLKGLFLDDTRLTDASVEALGQFVSMPSLVLIHLSGTGISLDGYVRLRQAIPEVNLVSEH